MPNRVVREGILTSERMNSLSAHAEVFYRRLMSVVDDYGRFDGRPVLLRVSCFPLRVNEVREADISRWIAECEKAGLIALYAVDGKAYVELRDFRQQVRAKHSKYPSPADATHMHSRCAASDSRCAAYAHLDGVEVEGEVDKPPSSSGDDGFAAFWSSYPRRVGKQDALKAWRKLKPDAALCERISGSVQRWRETPDWRKDGGAFIPHPATWLNGRRWEDELPAAVVALKRVAL